MERGGTGDRPVYPTHGSTSRTGRYVVPGLLIAVILAIAIIALVTFNPFADSAEQRAQAYAAAWQSGDDEAAAAITDAPAAALAALTASRKGLDGAKVRATVGEVSESDDRATARLAVRWAVPQIGAFAYRTRVELERRDDTWNVRWQPTAVHPRLSSSLRLGTAALAPVRGPILDRRGRALMSDREVMDVAVRVDRVRDPRQAAAALAALVDIDARRLERQIRDAPKGRFLPVVTLRKGEFDRVSKRLQAVRGVSLNDRRAPLAPTKGFARAVLGTVAEATAEQVERSKGKVRPGQEVGQWGLQARFDERLRGSVTRRVVTRGIATGAPVDTLLERKGRDGRALRTTLDRRAQAAAESALGSATRKAALVALQPSTGDLLAIANRPSDQVLDRALEGLYPPGSTFKVVSTSALLRDGLSPDEVVDCPATKRVGGRAFRNFEGGAAGAVPFRIDFAQSCNTAFVALASRLRPEALPEAARDFGLGEAPRLALRAATAKVPAPGDAVAAAASMIGQAEIVASPLAIAGVAGTVAAGRWRAPRLLRSDPRRAGEPLPPERTRTLRELMRSVVTSGTGTALAAVPGEVSGKSGTAEFGTGDPPPTHAWFIAFRGDVAMAVLVEGGRSGSEVAAPIAQRFFTALGTPAPVAPPAAASPGAGT
jgi:cell division protein FtsI/penicillin-binding protein 2